MNLIHFACDRVFILNYLLSLNIINLANFKFTFLNLFKNFFSLSYS